jgi:hypothetical protein
MTAYALSALHHTRPMYAATDLQDSPDYRLRVTFERGSRISRVGLDQGAALRGKLKNGLGINMEACARIPKPKPRLLTCTLHQQYF